MHSTTRNALAAAIVLITAALFIGALCIPFLFESPSMFYKLGWDKTMLRAAKMIALAAALLLLFQLPLAARLKPLDRIFSLPLLYTLHRLSAYAIVAFIIVHPVLVLAPDGKLMIPFESRYWPEWIGAALLLVVCVQFALGRWHRSFFRAYQHWLLLHRVLGITAMTLLIIHVLYVSETFEYEGLPRDLALVSAACSLVLWLWVRFRRKILPKRHLTVSRIAPAGKEAYAIDLKPDDQSPVVNLPGQFCFVSFASSHVSREPHPFTLSSTPSRPEIVQITVRCCGDWTRGVDRIEKGDKAYLQGPFGRFSHLLSPPESDIIMIAGGIGITPMLSMLRYMSDTNDSRRILLIWSNRSSERLFSREELTAISEKLTDFRWVPIFSRNNGENGLFGRLDRNKLESLLETYNRDGEVFLCGPPEMVKQLRSDLKQMGFAAQHIHTEAFGF